MSQHVVRFIKHICDDTGHPHYCTQAVVEIRRARSRDRAIEAAKHRFSRMRKIKCWEIHADSFEVDDNPGTLPTVGSAPARSRGKSENQPL